MSKGKIEVGTAKRMNPKYIGISATIIRADGTVEDLGVVAEKHFGIMAKTRNLINTIKQGLSKWK